ncbi:hypothetical protein Desaci_1317 [Desulfosporosinus acidiphilus SJ4]|uniref:DUF2313 domain-containing protein n=1 Tax=Desulfosporosinus acidiphilus (strain DSM 22704 / JCM 16185 / SJ4) TaxID=646529 RepID=I4D3G9_DESAJ|nr:putative phage tail protein [Desulfosporosinus acidiphilus]AFM40343.1 hypothetical protein Desaci_1317 [Desulfosporosinus acidiphilus SJ4]
MLSDSLPYFITSTQLFTELFQSEGQELDGLGADLSDLEAQFNVDTATWGLDYYEKELGIPTDNTKPLSYRASVIKSKWRGGGKLNSTLIKTVCDAFTNGNTEVTFDGTIKVKFNSILGIPPNLNDLKAAVSQIKPAYLELVYLFSYLLINEIHQVMTINQLDSTPLNEFAGGV